MNLEKLQKALDIWNAGPVLDESDYHNSTGYLSNSFIGDFIDCEYGAILTGALKEDSAFNQNFAVGHLVEAEIFEGETGYQNMLNHYKDNAIGVRGQYKWTLDCKEWAQSALRHENLTALLRAEGSQYHKVITFELHGMYWRGEIDYLNLNKNTEIDLKTTASDFKEKSFNTDTRKYDLTFIDKWNYHRQRAVYQYGINEHHNVMVQPRILAISKKTKSVKLFKFDDQERLDYEIKKLAPIVDRFKQVLSGEDAPSQCETCKHCVEAEDVLNEVLTSTYCAMWYE